ncbi:MAG TPA: ABC transporter ATP-binding protein [Motilibacteraceae bacterium]|nr:ABC transporter ATP-binding protein [Motilibacteraceae bacterium]
MSRPSEPVLRVTGLRKTYGTAEAPVRALRGVDLEVAAGEFVALRGPSGSGKSTLLGLVAGLEAPDEGEVLLAGASMSAQTAAGAARLRRRHVGMVFQFFHLIEGMSAHENVALAALVAGAPRRTADRRAHELLDLLGLLDKAVTSPAALSGGQRQRLAIARALAGEPTLLLADEPTGALDTAGAAEVLELFARLHRAGQAILLVTHSPDVAAAADRVVHLRDGLVERVEQPAAGRPVPQQVGS